MEKDNTDKVLQVFFMMIVLALALSFWASYAIVSTSLGDSEKECVLWDTTRCNEVIRTNISGHNISHYEYYGNTLTGKKECSGHCVKSMMVWGEQE